MVGGCPSRCHSPLLCCCPRILQYRRRSEGYVSTCAVRQFKVVLSLHLCHSLSPCAHTHTHTHTHTVEAAATEGEEEGGQVSSHCQFSAGSVSCVATYCTDQVEGESLVCAVTLTVYMYTSNSLNPSRKLIQVLWTEALRVVVCIVPDSYCLRLPQLTDVTV